MIEKDLRDHLQSSGYYGRTAEFARLELVAMQRPGWLQVFAFEVKAKEQEGDWVELFGVCRDDERSKLFDVTLSLSEEERNEKQAEYSDGLITLARGERTSLHFGLIAFCMVLLGLACFAAAKNFLAGGAISAEALGESNSWAQWGGPGRDFRVPAAPLRRDWGESSLSPAWSMRLRPECGHAGVVVEDGVLFTLVREDDSEIALAIDVQRGKSLWKQVDEVPPQSLPYGMGPFSTPLVEDGIAYFLGGTGVLSARRVVDGELVWQRDLHTDFPGVPTARPCATSPLWLNDQLILIHGAPRAAVISLDPTDGSVLWQRHDFEADYASAIAVEVEGAQQLVCQMKSVLVGLDPGNGDLLWEFPCEPRSAAKSIMPVDVGENSVILSTGTYVERLKLSSTQAETVWKSNRIRAQVGNLLYLPESKMLMGATANKPGGPVSALDSETGEVLWRSRDLDCGFLWQSGNDIFNLQPNGELILALVDRKEPTVITKSRPFKGVEIWGAPAMVGSVLFVKDAEKLVAVDLSPRSEP